MPSLLHTPIGKRAASARTRRRGFTLVEAVVALSVSGLLLSAVASQLVESAALSLRITNTLEHSRNARELIDGLTIDMRAAQIMRLYPDFSDRSSEARDGQSGNYLVLQTVSPAGTITRTVGYYVAPRPNHAGWALYRHDSDRGDSPATALPSTDSQGSHRLMKRAVRLPDSNRLFRCVRDRGVSMHGEFGATEGRRSGRSEFIRCTMFTRS